MIRSRSADGDRSAESEVDRAVTEVLAFVMVFSIVIGSVVLLYMTGFTAMTTVQEDEQLRNAERAMSSLSDNLNDVLERDGIEERNGEIQLREGSVAVDDGGTELTVEIDDDAPGDAPLDGEPIGSLTYERGSSQLVYEGGGVFRSEVSGSVPLDEPAIRCTGSGDGDTVAIVSVLAIEGDDRTVQSADSVEVEAVQDPESTTVETRTDGPYNVTIAVNGSAYDDGWNRALTRNGNDWNELDDASAEDHYVCENADRVTVRVTAVDVSISA